MFSWVSKLLKRKYSPDVASGRDALIRVIDDPASSTEQRKSAIRRLEQYEDSEAVAALARVVRNESLHDLRTEAAGRLGIMGAVASPAVDALIESLEHPPIPAPGHFRVVITNWRTRESVLALLPEIRSTLAARLRGDESVTGETAFNAVWLAGQIANEPDEQLTALLIAVHNAKGYDLEKAQSHATVALERIAPDYVAPFTADVSELLGRLESRSASNYGAQGAARRRRLAHTPLLRKTIATNAYTQSALSVSENKRGPDNIGTPPSLRSEPAMLARRESGRGCVSEASATVKRQALSGQRSTGVPVNA